MRWRDQVKNRRMTIPSPPAGTIRVHRPFASGIGHPSEQPLLVGPQAIPHTLADRIFRTRLTQQQRRGGACNFRLATARPTTCFAALPTTSLRFASLLTIRCKIIRIMQRAISYLTSFLVLLSEKQTDRIVFWIDPEEQKKQAGCLLRLNLHPLYIY